MRRGPGGLQPVTGGMGDGGGLGAVMRQVEAMNAWGAIVGEKIALRTAVERLDGTTLIVGVATHAWAEQLALLKPQILARYAQTLGKGRVAEISFHIGRRKPKRTGVGSGVRMRPEAEEDIPQAEIAEADLAGVSDEEVREVVAKALRRMAGIAQWRAEHGWARCAECGHEYHGGRCRFCNPPTAEEVAAEYPQRKRVFAIEKEEVGEPGREEGARPVLKEAGEEPAVGKKPRRGRTRKEGAGSGG